MIAVEIGRLLHRLPPEDEGASVWVFLLDLDGFKYVNDSWGHDTGDRLVIEVGERLRAAVPDDVPMAALGGDEFLLAYVGERDGAMRVLAGIQGCFERRSWSATSSCRSRCRSGSRRPGRTVTPRR